MAGKRTKVTLFFFFFYFGKQLSETSLLLLQTELFFYMFRKKNWEKASSMWKELDRQAAQSNK
jgi:hypothetical protein